jgi:hypothetical protein
MRKLISGILLIITVALFSISCTPESCFEETESFLKVTLYNYATKKAVAPDSISLWGLNNESAKIYNKAVRILRAQLPLNSAGGKSVFIIKINGITDTLKINYSSYPHLISKECGYTFYHNIETVDYFGTAIDSIYTGKTNITTLNEENMRIFY